MRVNQVRIRITRELLFVQLVPQVSIAITPMALIRRNSVHKDTIALREQASTGNDVMLAHMAVELGSRAPLNVQYVPAAYTAVNQACLNRMGIVLLVITVHLDL